MRNFILGLLCSMLLIPTGVFAYVVQKGDTLNIIANGFNTNVNDLVKLNNIKNKDLIYPGQVIETGNEIGATVVGVRQGGTGTSTVPSFGQLLMGDGNGFYNVVNTSSLGITGTIGVEIDPIWTSEKTAYLSTTTASGLYPTFSYASSTFATTSHIQAVTLGGTGTTTAPTVGQMLVGNGSGGYFYLTTSTMGITAVGSTLTRGTGLTGSNYNGSAPTTWAVAYGTSAGNAVQGNQTATILAGSGLTGGIISDALGDGFSASIAMADTAVASNTYGGTGANIPTFKVNTRGQLYYAADRALTSGDIGSVSSSLGVAGQILYRGASAVTVSTTLFWNETLDAFNVGLANTVTGTNSFSVGHHNSLVTTDTYAFGNYNSLSGLGGAIAVGAGNTIVGQNSTAIGRSMYISGNDVIGFNVTGATQNFTKNNTISLFSPYVGINTSTLNSTLSIIGTSTASIFEAYTSSSVLKLSVNSSGDLVSYGNISGVNLSLSGYATSTDYFSTALNSYVTNPFTVMKEPTGFPSYTDSVVTFVSTTRIFTIAPTGSSYDYYYAGKKFTTSTPASVVIPSTAGQLTYIYFNSTGNIATSTNSDDFLDNCQIATVYWDTTEGVVGYDRHGITMDMATHRYLHTTRGTQYLSGLTGTFDNTTSSFTAGVIADEDNIDDIAATTSMRIFYRNTPSVFNFTPATTTPYARVGSNIAYDNAGTLTALSANNYVAYWVFATNDRVNPIYVLAGQREDSNITDARNNNLYSLLSLGQMPLPEMKLLYRVIYRNDATPYEEASDYRTSPATGQTFVATQHNLLTGLDFTTAGHTGFAGTGIENTFTATNTFTTTTIGSGTGTGILNVFGRIWGNIVEIAANLFIPVGKSKLTNVAGSVAISTTTNQMQFYGTTTSTLISYQSFSVTIVSSTWSTTGTTTIPLSFASQAETWANYGCYTDTGTTTVNFGDGTNWMSDLTVTTTVGVVTTTSNNTFSALEKRYIMISRFTGSPNYLTCTAKKTVDAD